MSTTTATTPITNAEILWKLIQGQQAIDWANTKVGWNTGSSTNDDVCTWDGITCDPIDGSVISLDLSSIGISGTIPSELGYLTTLRNIRLSQNNLQSTLPPEILALPQLISLHVDGNHHLSGTFPQFQSTDIQVLNLMDNAFGGTLPEQLGSIYPQILELELANNTFTGTLPKDLFELTTVTTLNLAFNNLHGVIPKKNLEYMLTLKGLFLNDNRLYGPIPNKLANVQSLVQLFLQHNEFSGTIPESLSELHNLVDFFIDGNKLTGSVPMEFCDRTSPLNEDYFQSIPDSNRRNGCDSISCPIGFRSETGIFPCYPCPRSKFTPYLGWNGRCINVQEERILESLYAETKGSEWVNADRWNNPNVPHCLYEGIECNADGRIVNITLSEMNLQGTITSKLGRLGHLRNLRLDGNHLTGIVPSDLRLCPLETLKIENNQFWGPIPPLLCQKEGLNGNGNTNNNNILLSCDVVACPVNTWHQNGRASTSTQHCLACPNQPYVGQTHCPNNNFATEAVLKSISNVEDYASHGKYGRIILVTTVFILLFSLLLVWRRRKERKRREESSSLRTDTMKLTTNTEMEVSETVDETQYNHHLLQQQEQKKKGRRSSTPITATTSPSLPTTRFRGEAYQQSQQQPQRYSTQQGNMTNNTDDTLPSFESHPSSMARAKRDASPVDDPDTQDLWLDVPKIE